MQSPSSILAESAAQLLRLSKPSVRPKDDRHFVSRPRNRMWSAGMAVVIASVLQTSAATVNWDADAAGPLTGGSGTWNTTSALWDDGLGNYAPWSNAVPDGAVFAGTAGTVSLGEAIAAASVLLNTSNYAIDLNGFDLTVAGLTGGTAPLMNSVAIRNTSPTTATYSTAGFGGNGGPRLTGNLNVVYTGGAWNPSIGNHDFTGTLSLLGTGTIRSDGVPLGSDTGLIRLGGTHTLQLGTASGQFRTFNRDIDLLGTASFNTGGVRTLTLAGDLIGTGEFRLSGSQGLVVLTGTNTYSGATYLTGAGLALVAASDTAFGGSTLVETRGGAGGSATASTIGFQGNVNIGNTAKIVLPGGNPATGLGALQNFGGHNTFGGNIELGSNTPRVFGVNVDSSLTLTGVISQARGFTKVGEGTLVLTGQNTYGTSSSATQGWTAVNGGVLRLDFSQTVPGHDADILNFSNGSNTGATYLSLGGGTLEIKGRAGATNSQRFKNNAGAGLGFTINPGASAVLAVQNDAASLSANFGQINNRTVGGSVDFVLPTTGTFTLPTGTLPTTGAAGLIVANGAAFMTVAGADWAARDGSNNIVPGSSLLGFHTPNDGTTLAGNADMSGGVNTMLASDTTVASLRFNDTAARTIVSSGAILTTGGILVTPNVGDHETVIAGGVLRAAPGAANQDLVIIQGNSAGEMVIASGIVDTTLVDGVTPAAAALTKGGAGVLVLTGANSYTGVTTINDGILRIESASALGSGNLAFHGGVVGLTGESGNFTRALGTGAGTVRFYGSGGFAAYGGDRTVNLGGSSAAVSWNNGNFVPTMANLILGAPDADGTVIFENPINTLPGSASPLSRTIQVENGSAPIDARLTGVISAEGGIIKTGPGTLETTVANTYTGPTSVNEGTLLVSGSLAVGSPITVQTAGTLNGTGSVGGITLLDGGTIAPGGGVGTFNTRSLALNGGNLALEFSPTFEFDQLNVVGTVRLGGPVNLTLALTIPYLEGIAFTIINNDLADAITFADSAALFAYGGVPLAEGASFTVGADFGSQSFQISYVGGDGNDVVLTSVPEPGAAGLILGGLGAFAAARRRRSGV
jgi:fibronectin-binding autotransporter adhesin